MLARLLNQRSAIALALAVVLLGSLTLAASALGAGPATVTVRVEGLNETKLPATAVTTTSTPVIKDGNPEHSCTGTSAAGALELATSGNWSGTWFTGLGYSAESIEGESHLFEPMAAANFFWSFWINDKPSSVGICEAELQTGDELLFFPSCFSESNACPPEPGPLDMVAPVSANVGKVKVTVARYDASGTPAAESGATVTGGAENVTTDSAGQATVTFTHPGEVTLQASAPGAIRTEANVCVHQGSDGTCGTAGSGATAGGSTAPGTPGGGVAGSRSNAPFSLAARIGGLHEGEVFSRAGAPRLLQGRINLTSGLRDVQLRLTRRQRMAHGRRRCSYYDGSTASFHAMHCGAAHGRYFSIGAQAGFSYLLPAALSPGRYVLDIEATDAAGDRTTLARGASRLVFYVR